MIRLMTKSLDLYYCTAIIIIRICLVITYHHIVDKHHLCITVPTRCS